MTSPRQPRNAGGRSFGAGGIGGGGAVDPVEVVTDPAAQAALSATFAMVVNHGDDPDEERPDSSGFVLWVGSVEPANATDGDGWVNTAP